MPDFIIPTLLAEEAANAPYCAAADTATVHLVTSAPTPSARTRLSVCFGALCEAGTSGGTDEETGLPCEAGTKDLTGVTCLACLAAATSVPVYRAQVLSSGEWATVAAFLDFEPARFRAEAERGDGYKSRVKQPAVWS